MISLRPRWLIAASLAAAVAGAWLAIVLFEALAQG